MSTASFGRCKSGDRFYYPPGRRQQQQQQQQVLLEQKHKQEEKEVIRPQKQQNQQHNHQFNQNRNNFRRQKSVPTPPEAEVTVAPLEKQASRNRAELDDCASTATNTTVVTPIPSVSTTSSTNFDRFLEHTTPLVAPQYFSKTSTKGWKTHGNEFRPYFVLGDLWESFKEWSAYGAGVPLLLNGSDSVVQYYVPYLSGIQLYIDPSKPSPGSRRPGVESDESSRETSSNGSSDCEIERGLKPNGVWKQQELADSNPQGVTGLSRGQLLNGSSSDEGESSSSQSVLVFEYFEHDSPFIREPLADKISLLASRFPELKTYQSHELSLSSWMSVAWYPIYRIPTGPTLQNVDSCFLTFHFLSTPISGGQNEWQCHFGSCPSYFPNGFDMAVKRPLPIFGMAYYKFKTPMWDQNGVDESLKVNSLLQAADEWLRHLNVNLPDYNFFASHGRR
ncbi:uncharacterized protein LOC141657118 [Silene latifolia]|uniref:uncharacterized protein LOC141657118 n=1 Tax=Silene latifolia TaxID=37657 RepID=UPI003D77C60A